SYLKNEEIIENYGVLFSTYRKMLENDSSNFFIDAKDKEKICLSLDSSIRALGTNEKGLQRELAQLKKGDRTSYILLGQPIIIPSKERQTKSHCVGIVIYKNEKEDFSVYLVDKNKTFEIPKIKNHSVVNHITISKKQINKFTKLIAENKIVTEVTSKNEKFLEQLFKLAKNEITPINIKMSQQVVDNCYIKEIEAAFKVSLFHCKKDIDSLSMSVTPKWNDLPDSTLKMREKFKDALKEQHSEVFNKKCDELYAISKNLKNEINETV
ncbi:hypothetical protein KGC99_002547, partial [Enterococcus hirae]|nr:hypothetical protein [Enterococcus hirae]